MRKILVYTSLFPNQLKPDLGVFIKKRMFAYAHRNNAEIRVVAPLPYSPNIKLLQQYAHFLNIPEHEKIEDIDVYHPRYPLLPKISMPFHGCLMYYGTKRFLRRLRREFSFDIIDAHFVFPDCQAAVQLGKLFNIPVISSARGSDINQYTFFRTIKPQIKKALDGSAEIISVCRALKDDMIRMGISGGKITVIPNGIDTELFYPLRQHEAIAKLGLAGDKKIIVSVGALIHRKSHDLTIRSVDRLVKKGYPIHLYILGEGDQRRNLEHLIRKLNLPHIVHLIGHVPNEDLVFWYNAADLSCLSSIREGWANVLTESLACGTPVVATNVFGASEIIRDESMGVLVKRTVEDITRGIELTLGTNWNRESISKIISERTWDVVAEEVHNVFEDVITRKSS